MLNRIRKSPPTIEERVNAALKHVFSIRPLYENCRCMELKDAGVIEVHYYPYEKVLEVTLAMNYLSDAKDLVRNLVLEQKGATKIVPLRLLPNHDYFVVGSFSYIDPPTTFPCSLEISSN